jgi:LPXTG-motif cell wall-anchored protein
MPFGPRLTRVLGAAAAVLALAPSTALAQGAGDDQYNDPFGSNQQQATPTPTPRAPAATPAPAAPPAQPARPAATATAAPPGPAATAAPTGPTLPYTGVDAWPLAAGGALLLGTGLTLRRRLREPD